VDTRLAQVPLFEGMSEEQLDKVASIATQESFRQGQLIFREGEIGEKLYLVLGGNVRISKRIQGVGEEALAILEPGSCFGEMALIDNFPRSADARAHSDCLLSVIRKGDLEDLLRVDHELAYEILLRFVKVLSSRLRETNEKIKVFFALSGGF
jgi:CRP/FNR family cyclic AMP-dependent transcriptional regulator